MMKAIAYRSILPSDQDFLEDVVIPAPADPKGQDILVKIEAVSVNPVDTKVRVRVDPQGEAKVLGYDAAGIVEKIGPDVTLFQPGDRVYYAGAIDRAGSNSEYHLVDQRIVAAMPRSLDFAAAAALPLTAITAWEALFDRLQIRAGEEAGTLLIIGGAGGVGSIAIQLARHLTNMTVIATASRPESQAWCRQMGAHHVIDHHGDLVAQAKSLNLSISHIFTTNGTDHHWASLAEIIAPQGQICLIDDPDNVDIGLIKQKSVKLSWEFMFTRSLFQTADMVEQHHLLTKVAALIDQGTLQTTGNQSFGTITAANLRKAHLAIESGATVGKITLAGFDR